MIYKLKCSDNDNNRGNNNDDISINVIKVNDWGKESSIIGVIIVAI